MSLAASGGMSAGAAVGGGLAMAHQAQAMVRPSAQPPPGAQIPGSLGGGGPPGLCAALGADLVDKNQLSMRQAKNVSHLPVVAIDIYGTDPMVASFPPKPEEPDLSTRATIVGKLQAEVSFNKNEDSHKILRKYLSKDKSYEDLRKSSLCASKGGNATTLEKPHQWMGMRRLQDTPDFIKDNNPVVKASSNGVGGATAAISEEASLECVHVTNGTLDGVSAPKGDDFDRVVYKIRLANSKKAVTMLPEEATNLILAMAQTSVARKNAIEEDPLNYPVALALPAWACHDAAMEAWMDSVPGAVYYQRSVAALCGALQPTMQEPQNALLTRITKVTKALLTEHQRRNDGTNFDYEPLVVLVGVTDDGIECTAAQVSDVQENTPSCVFSNFKILCNVSYPTNSGLEKIEDCMQKLYNIIGEVAPELDGPVGIVSYATNKDQLSGLMKKLESCRANLDTWEKVPILQARLDCVAIGTATLGAVTHGRLARLTTGASGKAKPALALQIHDVAPTEVGVRMSYKTGIWAPVKTIFAFDRRVPAGPYGIDLSAAQCAAHLQVGAGDKFDWDSDALSDAIDAALKDVEGKEGIPKREAAALCFKIQIVQKLTRDSDWVNVGDEAMPLTKTEYEGEKEKLIACENIMLELSVNSTGVITQSFVGQLETVVQAVVTSRNSRIRYWIGIILAIAFFGGFLLKSYWEERVFKRDTNRLLTYYKHALAGSMADGDKQNAKYLVWKYRGKANVLWRRLEKKYNIPVRHAHEWEDFVAENEKEEEIEEENLDLDDLDNDDAKQDL